MGWGAKVQRVRRVRRVRRCVRKYCLMPGMSALRKMRRATNALPKSFRNPRIRVRPSACSGWLHGCIQRLSRNRCVAVVTRSEDTCVSHCEARSGCARLQVPRPATRRGTISATQHCRRLRALQTQRVRAICPNRKRIAGRGSRSLYRRRRQRIFAARRIAEARVRLQEGVEGYQWAYAPNVARGAFARGSSA